MASISTSMWRATREATLTLALLCPAVAITAEPAQCKGTLYLTIDTGWAREAQQIQRLFLEGKREEAARVIPDELADSLALIGPRDRIKDRLQAWRESRVTTLLVATTDVQQLRAMAELIL